MLDEQRYFAVPPRKCSIKHVHGATGIATFNSRMTLLYGWNSRATQPVSTPATFLSKTPSVFSPRK